MLQLSSVTDLYVVYYQHVPDHLSTTGLLNMPHLLSDILDHLQPCMHDER